MASSPERNIVDDDPHPAGHHACTQATNSLSDCGPQKASAAPGAIACTSPTSSYLHPWGLGLVDAWIEGDIARQLTRRHYG